jgi:glutaredoxin-related protein
VSRPILDETRLHPAIRQQVAVYQDGILKEVQAALAAHPVLVVGMAHNPYCRKARQVLEAEGIAFHYLEYGNYFSQWQARGALKMWTGWPTFPMVFVNGALVGGYTDLKRLIENGELKR